MKNKERIKFPREIESKRTRAHFLGFSLRKQSKYYDETSNQYNSHLEMQMTKDKRTQKYLTQKYTNKEIPH